MYTLRITDENSVISTRCTLMEKSNCVDEIQIIVNKLYKDKLDMSDDMHVFMKYVLPISKKIKSTELEISEIKEDEGLIYYKLPVDVSISAEPGDVEVSFTFLKLVHDDDTDTTTSYIRKTESGIIHITKIAQFDGYEPNEMFSEFDQRLLEMIALANDIKSLNQNIYDNMAKDVRIDEDKRKITLINSDGDMGDGIDITDLSEIVAKYLTGVDPDGVQDGVVHIDKVPDGIQTYNLDKLLK